MDEYIKQQPKKQQNILNEIVAIVQQLVPDVQSAMAYGIPTFKYKGKNFIHFAAYEKHIGFYPTPSVIKQFKVQLHEYKCAKGSVQFPLNNEIPYDLIAEMIKFRFLEFKS